jgi:hypothetical protein
MNCTRHRIGMQRNAAQPGPIRQTRVMMGRAENLAAPFIRALFSRAANLALFAATR